MTTDYINQMTENFKKFASGEANPAAEIQKVTTETLEAQTRKNLETINSAVADTTKNLQKLAGVKKFEELTNFYRDFSKEANEKTLAYTKEVLEDALTISKKYAQAIEASIDSVKKSTGQK